MRIRRKKFDPHSTRCWVELFSRLPSRLGPTCWEDMTLVMSKVGHYKCTNQSANTCSLERLVCKEPTVSPDLWALADLHHGWSLLVWVHCERHLMMGTLV
jgi:hypothetical protein